MNWNQRKVSVIIPVYNVEQYLAQCVSSVIAQTYADLQIVLVDDGSTDSSGAICDEFARKDDRIAVIHKENGGLSDARNAGTQKAVGEFLFYLDSDDTVSEDAIESLIKMQSEKDSDVVISSFFYQYADRNEEASSFYPEVTSMNGLEALAALAAGRIQTFAWGKLIRTELAKRHAFPVRKRFEDHFWTHYILAEASGVTIIPDALVYYRQRADSITFTFDMKRLDVFDGLTDRIEFLKNSYSELVPVCLETIASQYVNTAWLVLTRMKKDRKRAFSKMREFNRRYHLEAHTDKKSARLISALDRGIAAYAVRALLFRLQRGS